MGVWLGVMFDIMMEMKRSKLGFWIYLSGVERNWGYREKLWVLTESRVNLAISTNWICDAPKWSSKISRKKIFINNLLWVFHFKNSYGIYSFITDAYILEYPIIAYFYFDTFWGLIFFLGLIIIYLCTLNYFIVIRTYWNVIL